MMFIKMTSVSIGISSVASASKIYLFCTLQSVLTDFFVDKNSKNDALTSSLFSRPERRGGENET